MGVAPSELMASWCFGEAAPIAGQPCARSSSSSAVPTPPLAPVTSALWPGRSCAVRWIIWYAVM